MKKKLPISEPEKKNILQDSKPIEKKVTPVEDPKKEIKDKSPKIPNEPKVILILLFFRSMNIL